MFIIKRKRTFLSNKKCLINTFEISVLIFKLSLADMISVLVLHVYQSFKQKNTVLVTKN